VGWSSFLSCGFTTDSLTSYLNTTESGFESALADGFNSDGISAITRVGLTFPGPFCQNAEDPAYLSHINTPNIARDMDLIRSLTGYQTLEYWGFSYGTLLGTMYAALFPNQVGKMILDGFPEAD
jgi:pimeloyl-ACP methyl ester carboxylesterase